MLDIITRLDICLFISGILAIITSFLEYEEGKRYTKHMSEENFNRFNIKKAINNFFWGLFLVCVILKLIETYQ